MRNHLPMGGLLVGLFGVVSYFAIVTPWLAPHAPFLRDVPVVNLAIVVLGLALSAAGLRRAFSPTLPYRGKAMAPALGAANLALALFFGWYLFDLSSRLPEAAAAPPVGAEAPDFELADENGQPVRLSALRGRNVLLVFYRGHW